MPQGSGYMNTAPPPIPGGYGNPTGANKGGMPGVNMTGLPPATGTIPMVGSPTNTLPQGIQPAPGAAAFPANGVPTGTGTDIAGLNSGFTSGMDPKNADYLKNEFIRAYGGGTGQMLFDMMSKGMFNPQVAQAMINAMQPSRARGLNDVQNSFGSMGARFSSAAALGVGDFESQFALNEQQVLAQLFQHDQDLQVNLLENTLPTLHTEAANDSGGSIWGKILGGLEIAGGLLAAPMTGGMSLGLAGSGIGTLSGSFGGSGGGSNKGPDMSGLAGLFKPGGTSDSGFSLPGMNGISNSSGSLQDLVMQGNASRSITGDPTQGATNSGSNDQLLALLKQLGVDPSMLAVMGGTN